MKSTIVLAVVFLAFPLLVEAAPGLSVAYLEGRAYVQSGASWSPMSIGDTVPGDATVRLDAGAYIQLKAPGTDIILTRKGTYAIRNLLSMQQSLRVAGVGKALLSSFSYMLGGGVKNQSSTLGARGADESKVEDSGWVESNAQVFLDSGKSYLQSAQYDKAIEQFKLALDSASGDEQPEIWYNLAFAYSLSGATHEALKQASRVGPGGADPWLADFVILKAKLLVDTNSFAEDVQWLTENGKDLPQDDQRAPVYFFLLGLGYRGIGDIDNEKASLAEVVSMSKESEIGRAAAQLLQNP